MNERYYKIIICGYLFALGQFGPTANHRRKQQHTITELSSGRDSGMREEHKITQPPLRRPAQRRPWVIINLVGNVTGQARRPAVTPTASGSLVGTNFDQTPMTETGGHQF